jgi:hypothetical protein
MRLNPGTNSVFDPNQGILEHVAPDPVLELGASLGYLFRGLSR